MNAKIRFQDQLHFYLLLLIAVALPFNQAFGRFPIISYLIGILFLNWIIQGQFIKKFYSIRQPKFFVLFSSLWVLFAIGLFWTEDHQSGHTAIILKAPLIIFPLVLSNGTMLTDQKVTRLLWSYVFACSFASLVCLSIAFHRFQPGEEHLFVYHYLSKPLNLHPAYLGLMNNLAVFALLKLAWRKFINWKVAYKALFVLLILWLIFFTFMLAARSAILTLLIVLVVSLTYGAVKRNLKKWLIPGYSALIVGLVCLFTFSSYFQNRVMDVFDFVAGNKESVEITDVNARTMAWRAGWLVFTENWISGSGTGDAQNEIERLHAKNAIDINLNAHNQFLQTGATVGIVGILVLLLGIMLPFQASCQNGNFLYLTFLFTISLCMLTESLLERQMGVIFYSFWNAVLAFQFNDENP